MKLLVILFFLLSSFCVNAKFIGGIGYIQPGQYRVDNQINPLPLGISLVPLILYRGERLSVFGPNINYAFFKKGPLSISASLSAAGDRYKTNSIDKRDTAINAGFSIRFMFLGLRYGSDISNIYHGSTMEVNIGWRFTILDGLVFTPSIGREYLNQSYVNYYYGVSGNEAGRFTAYNVGRAINVNYKGRLTYALDELNSLTLSYAYKVFDRVIFDSPTINRKSFGTTSVFWNYIL